MSDQVRPVDQWRRTNLQNLLTRIDSYEHKAKKTLSEVIAKRENKKEGAVTEHLTRILKGTISFGDIWLSYIEEATRDLISKGVFLPGAYLESGFLDMPPKSETVAYVLATVDIGAWNAIYSELKGIQEINEASLVFGGERVDAVFIIKSTPDRINDILLQNISGNPKIHHTQTLHTIDFSQWQQPQEAKPAEPEKLPKIHYSKPSENVHIENDFFTDYKEVFKDLNFHSSRIEGLFETEWNSRIDDLYKIKDEKHITIKSVARLNSFPEVVVDSARKEIRAIVVVDEISEGDQKRIQRYLDAQRERMQRKSRTEFKIRRVFVVNRFPIEEDKQLCWRMGCEIDIGIGVRYIKKESWPSLSINEKPKDFGIIDNALSWQVQNQVNHEGMRQIDCFLMTPELSVNRVKRAIDEFELIWDDAREIDPELKRHCLEAFHESSDNDLEYTPG